MAVAVEREEESLLVLPPCVLEVGYFFGRWRGWSPVPEGGKVLAWFSIWSEDQPSGREDVVRLLLPLIVSAINISRRLSATRRRETRGVLALALCP
jgi:hypothetical protein